MLCWRRSGSLNPRFLVAVGFAGSFSPAGSNTLSIPIRKADSDPAVPGLTCGLICVNPVAVSVV